MLRAAARVIRADLRGQWTTGILTGLVIAIAAGALLVTLAIRAAIDDPFDTLMRATNGPHALVDGTPAEARRVAALPVVAEAGPARVYTEAQVSEGRVQGRIRLEGLEPGARIDRPLVTRGRAPRRPGEVMVARPLAQRTGLVPGKAFSARGTRLTVVGIAVTPIPEAEAWVVPSQARALAHGAPARVTIPLRLRDAHATGELMETAEQGISPRTEIRDWLGARADYTDDARRMLTILQSATLLALLAAGFTLATAIGGRVIGDRRRIGLLRAVGVTPRGVTALLVAHYVVLAVLAAPVGLAAGLVLAPGLLGDTATALAVPAPGPPGPLLVLATLLAVLALVAVATAIPAWRAGRLAPVDALALGRGTAAARASRFAAAGRALRLPPAFVLGAEDAFARPTRAVLTVASLALAAVLVVCTMGFEATMDRLSSDSALRAQPWELRVQTEGDPAATLGPALQRRSDVTAIARIHGAALESAGTRVGLFARVLDPVKGDLGDFPFAIRDGRPALRTGEATLGRGALDALHARIGDTVRLTAAGRPFSVKIVGRHVEPDDDGRVAVMSASTIPPAAIADQEDADWALRLAPGADPDAVRAAAVAAGDGRASVAEPADSLRSEAADMRPIVYGLTALLMLIAGVNLLTTLLLGVRERRRDVAVLSAVGATPRQVAATVIAGGTLLALPAAAVGLPLGAWVFRTLISSTDPSDGPDVVTMPAVGWIVLALPVAIALTAAVASLAGRQAARIPAAAALRAE